MKMKPIGMTGDNVYAINMDWKTQTRRVMEVQPSIPGMQITTLMDSTSREERRHIGKHQWATVNSNSITVSDEKYFKPRYQVGDILIPRCTWAVLPEFDHLKPSELDPASVGIWFWYDGMTFEEHGTIHRRAKPPGAGKSRPGRFLPKTLWHYMPLLEVTAVRVERVQDISEADAIAEGVEPLFTQQEIDETVGLYGKPQDYGWKNYLWHGHIGRTITAQMANSWPHQYSSYETAVGSFSSLWEKINGKRGHGWEANDFVWATTFKPIADTTVRHSHLQKLHEPKK